MCNSQLIMHQKELTWKLLSIYLHFTQVRSKINLTCLLEFGYPCSVCEYSTDKKNNFGQDEEGNWSSLPKYMMIQITEFSRLLYFDIRKHWKFKFERIALSFKKYEKSPPISNPSAAWTIEWNESCRAKSYSISCERARGTRKRLVTALHFSGPGNYRESLLVLRETLLWAR